MIMATQAMPHGKHSARCGATLDVTAVPRPRDAPLERWLLAFPSFGYLLATTDPERTCEAFTRRGLAAAACGTFDAGHALLLADGSGTVTAWDLAAEPLTGLGESPSAGA
jgi:selenophosphate synthetase-related protein